MMIDNDKDFVEDNSTNKTCNHRSRYDGKKGKRNRNRKKRPKYDSRFERAQNTETYKNANNDIGWYSKNASLLQASASFPYAYPVGDRLRTSNQYYDPETLGISVMDRMPGIITMNVLPGPGISTGRADNEISPVNVAARDVYSYVRYANSGHANYDPADLMMYMLGIDEVYMELADAKRIYGIVNLINPQNRFVPKYLVQALGWDYDDVITNMAQFRYVINSTAARIAALNMPSGFPYFDRHKWIFSHVYVDGTSPKAQLLVFKKDGYRIYDETGDTGSKLVWKPSQRGHGMKVTEWYTNVISMINALVGSEDCGIISGDILKAFGTDKCYSAEYMPDNYAVFPEYSEEVMSQISNSTLFEAIGNPASLNITQDPSINKGTIIYVPTMGHQIRANNTKILPYAGNQILSFQKDVVTNDDTTIGTRLTATANPPAVIKEGDDILTTFDMYSAGSELLYRGRIWIFSNDGTTTALTQVQFCGVMLHWHVAASAAGVPDIEYQDQGNVDVAVADLLKFRFHPPVVNIDAYWDEEGFMTTGKAKYGSVNFMRDIDTYTVVTPDELKQLHEACLLSEFNVPIEVKVSGKL